MSNLKPDDKHRERRKSLTSDNEEIADLFQMKLQVSETIKKYISAKVNYQLKSFENKICDDLLNKWMDDLDRATGKMIERIERSANEK